MTQRDRDRLVVLKKALKKLIKQSQAAKELDLSPRQVRRLLRGLEEKGDKVVIHGLRGQSSKRKTSAAEREKIIQILSQEVYQGFGPTLASEYLAKKHSVKIGREALRQIMIDSGLWRARKQKVEKVHQWRPRRSCRGELVQWDTSDHDWLEGRGKERLYLIHMIDDATSQLTAGFVRSDSTEENMRVLWMYLERHGRPAAFYTDKASLFVTTPKTARDAQALPRKDREPLPPTQIGRALRELGIVWIAAHSPQAKGRVERSFGTAQDRLVKGLRVAGVRTLEEANGYLQEDFLPWWNQHLVCAPANATDATPSAGLGAQSGGVAQRGGDASGRQRLHAPGGWTVPADRAEFDLCRITRSDRAHRAEAGWQLGSAFPRPLSGAHRLRGKGQAGGHAQTGLPTNFSTTKALGSNAGVHGQTVRQTRTAGMEGRPDRSHPHCRQVGGVRVNKERRAKAARRSSRFIYTKTAAQGLHQSRVAQKNQNPQNGHLMARFDWGYGAICFGANPVAAVFVSAPGSATPPEHRIHFNPTLQIQPSKADISTWQRIGHFYLALTGIDRSGVVSIRIVRFN